jgi:hypothetical protein
MIYHIIYYLIGLSVTIQKSTKKILQQCQICQTSSTRYFALDEKYILVYLFKHPVN